MNNLPTKEEIRQQITDNASLSVPYVVMNTLATIVASYGLLADSTAVVIGAMIIAMLLSPITGIALGLVDGDNDLLRKAAAAEIVGILIVLTTAFLIGSIHDDIIIGNEITSRTAPNILDLMIALAGGAAGAYAMVSPRLSVGLVGVAIATALVPPLSTCSILLARGETKPAFGALLLFVANFVAIQFASSMVMWLHGYHRVTKRERDGQSVIFRNLLSFSVLAILAIVLGINFVQSLNKRIFQAQVRRQLEKEVAEITGTFLADLRFDTKNEKTLVIAVMRTPFVFSPEKVAEIEQRLPKDNGELPELHVRSVLTNEVTRDGLIE